MTKPINWGGLLSKYLQPLKERASVLPLGQYEDGSVGLAWPGILADPVQRGYQAANTPVPAINDDQAWADKSAAMFDVASLAPMGAGLAGGIVDNAVGSAGGKLANPDLPATAALKYGDEIIPGKYHGDAIWAAVEKYGSDAIKNLRQGETDKAWNAREGFQTLGGDFISRKQAAENIRRSGLVPNEAIPDDFHAALLNEYRAQGLWSNPKEAAALPLAAQTQEQDQQTLTTANILRFLRGQ